jgi:hypothetical protein
VTLTAGFKRCKDIASAGDKLVEAEGKQRASGGALGIVCKKEEPFQRLQRFGRLTGGVGCQLAGGVLDGSW